MSVPNPIPHKTLYINDYICSCYAFVFIFEFSEYISKHILQFHASVFNGKRSSGNWGDCVGSLCKDSLSLYLSYMLTDSRQGTNRIFCVESVFFLLPIHF